MKTGYVAEDGFSFVELMMVVAILAVIIAMALPIYVSSKSQAQKRTCYTNQRILEGAVGTWEAAETGRDRTSLAGVINASHPIIVEHIIGHPPRCPSAPGPVNEDNPTAAEGAYTFDAAGNIQPCTHGSLGAHGHY